jgi:alkylhydroperoxidase family enzyme
MHECLAKANLADAPLSDAERGLLSFVEIVTKQAYKITDQNVEALRALGWSDEQIGEAVYVAAMFAFVNRIADAFGIGWTDPEPDSPTDLQPNSETGPPSP